MNLRSKLFWLLSLPFILVACEKEDQAIGLDLLHSSDLLTTYVDSTNTIITLKTVTDDTIRSSKITYMVGENYDNVFGKTRAGYATRLYFSAMIGDISQYKLDSVCFQLAKSSTYVYGDTTVAQTLSLYELNQAITVTECQNYNEQGTLPTCISAKTKIRDLSFPAYTDTTSVFSFKLNTDYASSLFTKVTESYNVDSSIQYTDSLFLKKFNGIYVTTKDDAFNGTKSVIAHCVPAIVFYLSGTDSTTTLTLSPSPQAYNEQLSTDPSQIYLQAINIFTHDYSSTSITLDVDSEKSYVQGFMGVKTKLNFSNLEEWRACVTHTAQSDSAVVINSAKLYLPCESRKSWDTYLPLNLRIYDESRNLIYTTVSTTEDSTNYVFNMQSFLVNLYNGSAKANTYSYEITVPENNTYGNMAIIDGTQKEKMKLVITYTK